MHTIRGSVALPSRTSLKAPLSYKPALVGTMKPQNRPAYISAIHVLFQNTVQGTGCAFNSCVKHVDGKQDNILKLLTYLLA